MPVCITATSMAPVECSRASPPFHSPLLRRRSTLLLRRISPPEPPSRPRRPSLHRQPVPPRQAPRGRRPHRPPPPVGLRPHLHPPHPRPPIHNHRRPRLHPPSARRLRRLLRPPAPVPDPWTHRRCLRRLRPCVAPPPAEPNLGGPPPGPCQVLRRRQGVDTPPPPHQARRRVGGRRLRPGRRGLPVRHVLPAHVHVLGEKLEEKKLKEAESAQRQVIMEVVEFNSFSFLPRFTKFLFWKRWNKNQVSRRRQMEVLLPLIRARMDKQDKEGGSYVDSLLRLELPEEGGRKLTKKEMVILYSEFVGSGD